MKLKKRATHCQIELQQLGYTMAEIFSALGYFFEIVAHRIDGFL